MRLQRVLADAGVAARRACEKMIEQGLVEVNGTVVTQLPVFVQPNDTIRVEGRIIKLEQARKSPKHGEAAKDAQADGAQNNAGDVRLSRRVYVMLNKPPRVMTTMADEGGRTCVADLVKHPGTARLFPVGRLDFHTAGLVLMTNDGELAHRLTHASYGVTRTFVAAAKTEVTPEALAALAKALGASDEGIAALRRGSVQPERSASGRAGDGAGRPARASESTQAVRVRVLPAPAKRSSKARNDNQSIREASGPRTLIEITLRQGAAPVGGSVGGGSKLDEILARVGIRVVRVVQTGLGPLELRGVAPANWRELERREVRALRQAVGLEDGPAGSRPPPASKDDRGGAKPRESGQ